MTGSVSLQSSSASRSRASLVRRVSEFEKKERGDKWHRRGGSILPYDHVILDGSYRIRYSQGTTISTDIFNYSVPTSSACSSRATLIIMTINILDVVDASPFLERLASCSPNTDLVIRTSELSQFTQPILRCLVSAIDYPWTVIANATTQLEQKTISHRVSRMKMRAYVGAYGHLSRDWKCSGCSDKPFCLRGTPDLEYAVDQQLLLSRSIITLFSFYRNTEPNNGRPLS